MIFRLIHIIPAACNETQNAAGAWVRAVPMPPLKGGFRSRLRAAWAVFWHEDVLAVHWPFSGEFEQAMARRDDSGSPRHDPRPVKPMPRLPEQVP